MNTAKRTLNTVIESHFKSYGRCKSLNKSPPRVAPVNDHSCAKANGRGKEVGPVVGSGGKNEK